VTCVGDHMTRDVEHPHLARGHTSHEAFSGQLSRQKAFPLWQLNIVLPCIILHARKNCGWVKIWLSLFFSSFPKFSAILAATNTEENVTV
jgi:hypothetical protein